MKEFDIDSVLAKARKLDEQVMAELYEHYHPKILKFIYYRVGPDKAEDLTSDVFIKVLRSIAKQNGNFDAWLYKIARNVIIDKARYANSRPEVELNQEYAEHIEDAKNVHLRIDAELDIQQALIKVNDEQREFLTLKFIQGLNNKEISAITGKSVGALRIMQFRALKALSIG